MQGFMKKLRVGVLMGGTSIEREVSFNSGRTVCDHLDTQRYDIIPIFQQLDGLLFLLPWHFLHRGKISDFEHRLVTQAPQLLWDDLPKTIDFMFIATHGKHAEDGSLQGFLEILNIPYLGSNVFASALGMDKLIQKEFLSMHHIAVPQAISIEPHQLEQYQELLPTLLAQLQQKNISFPVIVKPRFEGSSLGVSAVFTVDELYNALYVACYANSSKPQTALIEEKIEGMEFSCITITDYKTNSIIALPPTEVVHQPGTHLHDYEQKYMPGKSIEFTPARSSHKRIELIQETCKQVMTILGMSNFSRIDGFITTDDTIYIVDPNSISGMGPASFLFREAAMINMNHTMLINHLIETELQAYGMLETTVQHEQEHNAMNNTPKIRVAVLFGGRSNEKEISLESGRNVIFKLSPQKYEPISLFLDSRMQLYHIDNTLLVRNSTAEIEKLVTPAMRVKWSDLPTIADFAFIGLHGGEGENGCVQGTLEILGMPYNGSGILTSSLCMDKFKTTQFLASKHFDVPQGLLITKKNWQQDQQTTLQTILTALPLPLIIKPHDDGCSVMVQKITHCDQLISALEHIFTNGKEHALVEECIMGMELTVGVMGNHTARALPPSQAVCAGGILSIEEKFLPGAGENQTPAPLPQETLRFVQNVMEQTYTSLNCKGYVRIDCFYQSASQSPTGKQRVVILEINTLPGLTPATCIFHQAAEVGIRPMDFIDLIVTLGFEEHQKQSKKPVGKNYETELPTQQALI